MSKLPSTTVKTFRCAGCEKTFEKAISDEEANKEFEKEFPGEDIKESTLVCENCWRAMTMQIPLIRKPARDLN